MFLIREIMNEMINRLIGKIDTNTPLGLKALSSLIILVFILLFTHVFILHILHLDFLNDFPDWLVYLIIVVLFYFIQEILFSGDILYTGENGNNYVKIFQKNWPSRHIASKFNINNKDASYYWFQNYFNKWKKPDSGMYDQVKRTFKRGYECRLIYYCIRFFQVIIVLSFILFLIKQLLIPYLSEGKIIIKDINDFVLQIFFIIVFIIIFILVYTSNNPNYKEPKGVWKKFNEINEMHKKWIDENIKTFDDLKKEYS